MHGKGDGETHSARAPPDSLELSVNKATDHQAKSVLEIQIVSTFGVDGQQHSPVQSRTSSEMGKR